MYFCKNTYFCQLSSYFFDLINFRGKCETLRVTRTAGDPDIAKFKEHLNRIIDEYKDRDITQDQLAGKTDISPSTLSGWKNPSNEKMPAIPELARFCKHVGVSFEWLIGMPGAERDPNTTLAATGLDDRAISNLIIAERLYPGFSAKMFESKYIVDLIKAFQKVYALTAFVNGLCDKVEEYSTPDTIGAIVGDADTLEEYSKQLNWSRYMIFESCIALLNDISQTNIVLERAEKVLAEYEHVTYDIEGKMEDINGEY